MDTLQLPMEICLIKVASHFLSDPLMKPVGFVHVTIKVAGRDCNSILSAENLFHKLSCTFFASDAVAQAAWFGGTN